MVGAEVSTAATRPVILANSNAAIINFIVFFSLSWNHFKGIENNQGFAFIHELNFMRTFR